MTNQPSRLPLISLFTALTLLVAAASVSAADWYVDPGVSAGAEYNDNP